MKTRAIIVIDFELEGGFKEAAEEQAALEEQVEQIVRNKSNVVFHAVDMRERRGDGRIDLKSMKFRSY